MLRRLSLGVLALTALGLILASPAAAQDEEMSGSGTTGTSTPGMGMGPMGMPGMGPMTMPAMGMMGSPGAAAAPAWRTAIHHPGDLSGIVPCTGCGALADPCSFAMQCEYAEPGMWPDTLGLHPTTNHPDLSLYYPQGPMSCARARGNNPARCVDAPGEWNLRAGMPSGDMGGASR